MCWSPPPAASLSHHGAARLHRVPLSSVHDYMCDILCAELFTQWCDCKGAGLHL